MKFFGSASARVLIVGEAPGEQEDNYGRPFHPKGKAAARLHEELRYAGANYKELAFTNALICRPPNNKIANKRSVEYCRPNLMNTIKEINPKVIILLGMSAVKSLIGHLWREDVGKINRWTGWTIPCQRLNAWICPMNHPSYLLRSEHPVLDMMFRDQIRKALSFQDRPWDKIPNYREEIRTIFDTHKAAKEIRKFVQSKRPVAFDYETTTLKPDSENSRIVCCSLSDGTTTIAFPWQGEVITAMKEFFRSPVPKIASNMKFEDRWTRKQVGVKVNNWKIDTMLAAHVLDNRPGITSIKFQAFVHLGQESYDDHHIKPFLKTEGGNETNRITEIDMRDLLVYCGLDSLLEWKVAQIQAKEFNRGTLNP